MKVWVHLEPVWCLYIPLLSKFVEAGGTPGWSLWCTAALQLCLNVLTWPVLEGKKAGEKMGHRHLYLQLASSFFSSVFLAPHLSLECRTWGRRPVPKGGLPYPSTVPPEAVVTSCPVLAVQYGRICCLVAVAWCNSMIILQAELLILPRDKDVCHVWNWSCSVETEAKGFSPFSWDAGLEDQAISIYFQMK